MTAAVLLVQEYKAKFEECIWKVIKFHVYLLSSWVQHFQDLSLYENLFRESIENKQFIITRLCNSYYFKIIFPMYDKFAALGKQDFL